MSISINNWNDLIAVVSRNADPTFSVKHEIYAKLLVKINQYIKPHQKNEITADLATVKQKHADMFNTYTMIYDQILIENDIIDIFTEVKSFTDDKSIIFSIICLGKWIKIHVGSPSRLRLIDEEKTILNDKSIADFLNKIENLRSQYKYFGITPDVYYKFKEMPAPDIIKYFDNYGVIILTVDQITPPTKIDSRFGNRIIIDQSIIISLCSDLSYGLSDSFYDSHQSKTKESLLATQSMLKQSVLDKEILVCQHVYDQVKYKIDHYGGVNEKQRFADLIPSIKVVADENNPRFHHLKDMEILTLSVAERERAMIVTSNIKLAAKINRYYREIPYQIFSSEQLSEIRYTPK